MNTKIALSFSQEELVTLDDALDRAIDLVEMIIRSELPPRRSDWNVQEIENEAGWKAALRGYRRMRAKLLKFQQKNSNAEPQRLRGENL